MTRGRRLRKRGGGELEIDEQNVVASYEGVVEQNVVGSYEAVVEQNVVASDQTIVEQNVVASVQLIGEQIGALSNLKPKEQNFASS